MCIGIYLLCVGERDISFRGQYNQHAHQWMMSWQCTVIRVLAVSTSEVLDQKRRKFFRFFFTQSIEFSILQFSIWLVGFASVADVHVRRALCVHLASVW